MSIVYIQIFLFEEKLEPILVSIVLFYRALNAVLAVQSGFQGTFQLIGSMELVNEEFNNQKKNQELDGKLILNKFSSQIELRNVSFNYNNNNKSIINNISLTISINKSIALVGESGAGKSTLVDMITLMHKPVKGQILIDGFDSVEIEKSTWRKQIGYVSQETVIFNETLANNISMWSGDYDSDNDLKKQIRKAAKQANILDFIDSLPNGFNSVVGDRGILMSGGKKQRLFIARELFRKPKLLILDEATSSLDSESEKEIQKSIESLKGKVTVIIIAHRLSTIKNVDQIYVISNGKIIENGTFNHLFKLKNSNFKKLSELQSL
jgi:subfamily B ATP-binding cassette protein MsbA